MTYFTRTFRHQGRDRQRAVLGSPFGRRGDHREWGPLSLRRCVERRGVAMLLVIIGLAMATVLATSYLASRDNSAAIGDNLVDSAVARWISEAGLQYGIAILQTESNWRESHNNGKLIDDMPLEGATLDLDLVDLETQQPPDDDTTVVLLVSTATMGGIERVSTATAWINGAYQRIVDLDLGEFAIFASSTLVLKDDATVARWSNAPRGYLHERLGFGIRATNSSAVSVTGQALAVDTTLYHDDGASSGLMVQTSGPFIDQEALVDPIPFPDSPTAPAERSGLLGGLLGALLDLDLYGIITLEFLTNYRTVKVDGNIATIDADMTIVAEDKFIIQNGGGLIIDGDVTLVSFGDFIMQGDSFIELQPGARLTIFVYDQFDLSNSYIGDVRADRFVRDNSGHAPYMDPRRILVYDMDNSGTPQWSIRQNTVIKGSLYGRDTQTRIDADSAIYGRVAADHLEVRANGAIYYDPTLDGGTGYRNSESMLFDTNGTIRPVYHSLGSLDDSDVDTAALLEQVAARARDKIFDHRLPSVPPVSPPGEPTPRTISVRVEIGSIGTDVGSWEGKGNVHTMTPLEVASVCDDLANHILAYPLSTWMGADDTERAALANDLAQYATRAGNEVRAGRPSLALSELNSLYSRFDFEPMWDGGQMDPPERTELMDATSRVIAAVQQL